MSDIEQIKTSLRHSPVILKNLLTQIDPAVTKERRIPGKWSIHEHACHLVEVQQMLIQRFVAMRDDPALAITPHLPGTNQPDDHFIDMDLDAAVAGFPALREQLIAVAEEYSPEDWHRRVEHGEYFEYTPYVFFRHVLMHDHLHMYRIEELWLTRDEYLPHRLQR